MANKAIYRLLKNVHIDTHTHMHTDLYKSVDICTEVVPYLSTEFHHHYRSSSVCTRKCWHRKASDQLQFLKLNHVILWSTGLYNLTVSIQVALMDFYSTFYTALLQRILLLVEEKYTYHKNKENKIYSDFFSSEKTYFNIHVNPL